MLVNSRRLLPLWRRAALSAALAIGSVATGCSGGQTGGEIPATGYGDSCAAALQELTLDAATPLGVSAEAVIASVVGTQTAPLLWRSSTEALDVGPEEGLSEVELTVSYVGGSIAWVRYLSEPEGDGDSPSDADHIASHDLLECSTDRLLVDVVVRIRTAGGALDEHVVATLGAPAVGTAQLTAGVPLDGLKGSLSVTRSDGVSAPFIEIGAQWDAQGFRGAVKSGVEVYSPASLENGGSGVVVGHRFVTLAEWPPPADSGGR